MYNNIIKTAVETAELMDVQSRLVESTNRSIEDFNRFIEEQNNLRSMIEESDRQFEIQRHQLQTEADNIAIQMANDGFDQMMNSLMF